MFDIKVQLDTSWHDLVDEEFKKPYYQSLQQYLDKEREQYDVYPAEHLIFEAFNKTPFDKVKVVILGQDPYHNPGQAHGLCFSVPDGIDFPPSLRNILAELKNDLGVSMPSSGNLNCWAKQGVLLLNTVLTVRANQAGSHQKKGWEDFTDAIISKLSKKKNNLVFLLWGKHAHTKKKLIDLSRHHVIETAHPSPLSAYRGFKGCYTFSKANELLINSGVSPVDWSLDDNTPAKFGSFNF